MIGNLRRKEICTILKKQSAVTTVSLSKLFGVSVETVRKDLLMLEKSGELERVHGGAVPRSSVIETKTFLQRLENNVSEKREMSVTAAKYVKNGDIIAVDTGSTAKEFIEALKENLDRVTIVTHSIDVFEAACNYKNFDIILCGGFYLKDENSFYGDFALNMLDNIRVGKAFIFPASISLNNGIYDSNILLAQMQRKMISCANEVIIAADSSKFEKSSLIKVSDMSTKYTYITDSAFPSELKEVYKNNDINIITKESERKC
ncbi:MAG: DeoR/GlpR family DNA-binding transcription regulator [Clostridia bacterium]|nr:DeoR/GlpR family DNA-binding transcription regulator [Clostridia bacterium]